MAELTLDAVRRDALEYLRSGTSVNLRGLPGSGRSSLLRSIADALEAAGWLVVRVSGNSALADRPLEALALADLGPSAAGRTRITVSSAVEALRRALEGRNSVVVADDADLLDDASVGAISAAIDVGGATRVPLLSSESTARKPARLSLAALVHPGVQLSMPPVSFEDSVQIVRASCDGRQIPSDVVALMHARAGGLPGLIAMIASTAQRRGLIPQNDGAWSAGARLWTPELSHAVAPFLQGLEPAALDGITALALVGTVDIDVAQRLIGWEELEALDDRGLLTLTDAPSGVLVGVYPPLLAEFLHDDRISARRLRVLGSVSERLARADAPGQVQVQTRLADPMNARAALGGGGDREQANVVLNRLVFEKRTAESLVLRAEWQRRGDAASALNYALSLLVRGFDLDEAERVLSTPVAPADLEGRALLTVWRALLIAYAHHDLAAAEALLDEVRPTVGAWSRLLDANRRHLRLFLDRAQSAGAAGALPVQPGGASSNVAPPVAPPVVQPVAPPVAQPVVPPIAPLVAEFERQLRAEELIAAGFPERALAVLDESAPADLTDPIIREGMDAVRGVALVVAGRLDEAERWARPRYDDGLATLDPASIISHGYVLTLVYFLRGDEDVLREHIGPLLALGYTPLRYSHYKLGTLVVATRLAARSGRAAVVRSLAEQVAAIGLRRGPFPVMVADLAWAHADLVTGRDVIDVADELWHAFEDLAARDYPVTAAATGLRSIETSPQASRAADVAALAARCESELVSMIARYCVALSSDDAALQLREAAALAGAGYLGFGLRLRVAAVGLLGDDDPAAQNEAQQLRADLEQAGPGYRYLANGLAPAAQLTARERQLANLAAQGFSNQDIAERLRLSVRTVENHLSRSFRKLGIDSREALAAALLKNGV
ncbi:LuxR C-terminal-related transcriptional regulator [Gryllotalpicola reticulitermitis]|uniref:LuxR C-terminal-related transcriptional regulator n=1 Tax=Gryllotalpicola reticulitermitis TaxID=1184153 RepID=A0ABV8QAB6_9MICO